MVAQVVREAMQARKLTRQQVADRMGLLSCNTLDRVLSGENTSIRWLERFADALDVELRVELVKKENGQTVKPSVVQTRALLPILGQLRQVCNQLGDSLGK